MFNHALLPFVELGVDTQETGRQYILPSGKRLPSVTTVIGQMSDQKWKAAWINRVGEEEAARITTKAQVRGRGVHALAESYLRNDDAWKEAVADNPFEGGAFNSIKKLLDDNVGAILGIECPVYSERLGTAGRFDLLCEWRGRIAVVDFKTSRYIRSEGLLHNYFLQATAYSVMVEELHPGLSVPDIVVAVMPAYDPQPQIELRRKDAFVMPMETVFSRFRRAEKQCELPL